MLATIVKSGIHLANRYFLLRALTIGFTIVILGCVLVQTLHDLKKYPGIDMRSKVVGARLLIRGMDPYYDYRHELHSEHLRMLSDDTYSPAVLLCYRPLCELDWRTQRNIYFCTDWIAVLLCYIAVRRSFPPHSPQVALWAAFVLLFVATLGFRLHLERGQYYIELSLLIVMASVNMADKRCTCLRALPLALLVVLRPTFLVCIFGLLLLRRARYAVYTTGLCILLFAATLPLTGVKGWMNYVKTVRANEQNAQHAAYEEAGSPPLVMNPGIVEGFDFTRSLVMPGYLADRTLAGLARSSVSPALATLVHKVAPSEHQFRYLNTVCLIVIFSFDLAVLWCFQRSHTDDPIPIAFLFLAPLNLELFAPQHYAYCDVLILAPLLLILAASLNRWKRAGWVLYGAVLAVGSVIPWTAFYFNLHVQLASFFQYVGMLIILNGFSIWEAWKITKLSSRAQMHTNGTLLRTALSTLQE